MLKFLKAVAKRYFPQTALRVRNAVSPPRPKELIIDISGGCNASCRFCARQYMDPSRMSGFMSEEIFARTLDEAAKCGIGRLRFYATGEPLLHPHFDAFLLRAKDKGFAIEISTNASLLHRHFDVLLQADLLQFSIEGWDKESYEHYRRPLKFETTYRNVLNFRDFRLSRETRRPLTNANLLLTRETDIESYLELWGPLVDRISVQFMLPPNRFSNGTFNSIANSDIGPHLYSFNKNNTFRYCGYPFDFVTVSFDGKICLCCNDFSASLDLGMIQDGLDAVYRSPAIARIRQEFIDQDLTVCSGCNALLSIPQETARDIRARIDTHLRSHPTGAKVILCGF